MSNACKWKYPSVCVYVCILVIGRMISIAYDNGKAPAQTVQTSAVIPAGEENHL